jgi:hypothetical protein
MKELIERFYGSVVDGGPPPIPYREILLTARIMDAVFAQLDAGRHALHALPGQAIQVAERLQA